MQGRHLQFQNYPLFMEGRKKGDYRVVHWVNGSAGSNILALNLNHRDPGNEEDYRGSPLSKSPVARAESR